MALGRTPTKSGPAKAGPTTTMFRALVLVILLIAGNAFAAIDPALLKRFAGGDNDEKSKVIGQIVASGDPAALELFKSMAEGTLKVDGEEVVVNNRLRRELEGAMAAMKLVSPDL